MSFSEALELVKDGKEVRRKSWSEVEYLWIENGKLMRRIDYDLLELEIIRMDTEDILAEDWELYK